MRHRKLTGDLINYDGGKMKLADFGREWFLTYAKDQLARKTQIRYAGSWDRHILPRLGGYTLARLHADPQIIQRFAADLMTDGVGVEAVRTVLVLLQSVLQRAVEWNRIPDNPVRKVRKPASSRKRQAIVLAPDVIEAMRSQLLAETRPLDATLISVLAYAGLRPGEALALRWHSIGRRSIRVDSAASLGVIKSTKTGKARSVRLIEPLAEDLDDWRNSSPFDDDDDLVFPRPDGAPWTEDHYKSWVKHTFHRACTAAGVGKYVTVPTKTGKTRRAWKAPNGEDLGPRPYDLRHSFVSLLIHEGLSVVDVAAQAGHAPTMTLNTYAHVIAEFDPADRRPAEARIRDARNPRLRNSYANPDLAPLEPTLEDDETPA